MEEQQVLQGQVVWDLPSLLSLYFNPDVMANSGWDFSYLFKQVRQLHLLLLLLLLLLLATLLLLLYRLPSSPSDQSRSIFRQKNFPSSPDLSFIQLHPSWSCRATLATSGGKYPRHREDRALILFELFGAIQNIQFYQPLVKYVLLFSLLGILWFLAIYVLKWCQ